VLIVALGVPLTINLSDRVTTELENAALITTQGIAAGIDVDDLDLNDLNDRQRLELAKFVADEGERTNTRIVVVDLDGTVLADSDGTAVGDPFKTPGRPEIVDALERGLSTSDIRYSNDLQRDIMATAVPLLDANRDLVGAVRITQDVQEVTANIRRTTLGLLAIGAAGLIAGLLLAFGLAGSLSRPLTRLASAARRLGSGDLSARAEKVGGASEIEDLARSFDDMAGRLERTVQAQREFVANASHQLRTPLTGMKLRLESAIEQSTDDETRHRLEAADREVDRLAEIVDRLLDRSRDIEEGHPVSVDLGEAVDRAIARWSERAAAASSTLVAQGSGGRAQGNPSDVDQILDNLLENAVSYAPGPVTLESEVRDGHAVLAVQDRGPGIPEAELGRVTERFYRGKGAPAGGTGLGLAIVRDLAEKWAGSVEVANAPDRGTRVEVRLRAVEP
jgi:signal transduction histidine kinase